jgi:predicted Zn-dependent protease
MRQKHCLPRDRLDQLRFRRSKLKKQRKLDSLADDMYDVLLRLRTILETGDQLPTEDRAARHVTQRP